ncbi:MAG: PAS domain S-box protein [Nitrospirae bacterium]|nr:PAS domain S-box protein [Nitrospirota bacterium]
MNIEWKNLFEAIGHPAMILDPNHRILAANRASVSFTGLTQDEIIGKPCYEIFHQKGMTGPPYACPMEKMIGSGRFEAIEMEIEALGGIFLVSCTPFFNDQGKLEMIMHIATDITALRRAEDEALNRSRKMAAREEQLRVVFDTSQAGIIQVDPTGHIVFANQRMADMLRCSMNELIGSYYTDHVHPDQKTLGDTRMHMLIKGEIDSVSVERHYIRRDGSDFWGFLSGRRLESEDGKLLALIGNIADITDRREAEKALAFSEKRFRDLLETIQLAAVMLDLKGDIIFCNNFLLLLTGWTKAEVLNRNWFDLFIPETGRTELKEVYDRAIREASLPAHYENVIVTRDGKERLLVWDNAFFYDDQGKLAGAASIGIDVTDHRKVEEQLRQAQKMEAIGHLAGGIAHDFNNILTAIIGYGSLLGNMAPPESAMHDYVAQILASAERAASLTHSLLAFSRKQVINPVAVNIPDIVTGMQKILARVIGEDIEITLNNYKGDLIVRADRSQIEHAFMNLVTNARDAMPKGGRLTITTDEAVIDDKFIQMYRYGEPGRYAVVSFADTGSGMDTRTKDNMFEPFFTTKEVGKGTGLGLAMVYGTVKQHEGFINVYSEPGEGTTFRIYLPLIKETPKPESKGPAPDIIRGSETVLLVEDDEAVRKVTTAMLREFGYTVLEAGNSEEAVRIFSRDPGGISLVISDLIMPGLNGKEVYAALKRIRPDLKALFISGYSADILTHRGVIDETFNFMSKPLRPDSFSRKLRDILDGQPPSGAADYKA